MLLYTNLILILMVGSSFGWVDPRPSASSFGWVDPRPPAQCEDLRETCPEWVYFHYCDNPYYKTYMTIYCRRSCNRCTGIEPRIEPRTQDKTRIRTSSDETFVIDGVTENLRLMCDVGPDVTNGSAGYTDIADISYIQLYQCNNCINEKMVAYVWFNPSTQTQEVEYYDDFKTTTATAKWEILKGNNRGFMYVNVSSPTEKHTGVFQCQVGGTRKSNGDLHVIYGNKVTVDYMTGIEYLITKINNLESEMVNMVRKQEITQGKQVCTPIRNGSRYVWVNFGRTYAKRPRVFVSHYYTLGAPSGDVYGHNNNYIEAYQIFTTRFRLDCWSPNKMTSLIVHWIAFPRA